MKTKYHEFYNYLGQPIEETPEDIDVNMFCRKKDGSMRKCRDCGFNEFDKCPMELLNRARRINVGGVKININTLITNLKERYCEKIGYYEKKEI